MKTKVISILKILAGDILKICKEKNIPCTYLGLDDRNRMLMQLDYVEEEEASVIELEQLIIKRGKEYNKALQLIEALEKENVKLKVTLGITEILLKTICSTNNY